MRERGVEKTFHLSTVREAVKNFQLKKYPKKYLVN